MEIICNKCGAVIPKPDLKIVRDGEIEHTYFLCPDCGEAYRLSTTDKRLRKRIRDYNCCWPPPSPSPVPSPSANTVMLIASTITMANAKAIIFLTTDQTQSENALQ